LSLSMFKSALSGWFSKPRGFKDGKLERDPLVLLLLGCPGHGKTYLSRNAARSLVGEVCLSSRSLLRFVRSLLRVCEVSFALKLGLFCLKTRPPLTLMHTHTTHTHTPQDNYNEVACGSIRDDADLFGSNLGGGGRNASYSSKGKLIEWLRARQGQDTIVFLDEFEKIKGLTNLVMRYCKS